METNSWVRVGVRWMLRSDRPEVLEIDRASFDHPWDDDAFCSVLHRKNCVGMVACWGERVVGFMVYEVGRAEIRVHRFAVAPGFRRRGAGGQMVVKLLGKLTPRRNRLVLEVRETNLAAQLFWRELGFRAEETLRGHYGDTGEDAYRFEYRVPSPRPEGVEVCE